MNILVTGAKGFVGSALARALVNDPNVAGVVCLDVKETPGRLEDIADDITLLGGGVGDADMLMALMERHQIDAVAHMVYFASHPARPEEIHREVDTMARTTATVLEAARRTGARRVVLPSSIHFYGPQWRHGDVSLNEESDGLAESLYGVGKRFMEMVARTYNTRSEMEAITFRIPVVYGPGAKVGARGVNIPAVAAATGQTGTVPYGPEERICAAHVEDVADVLRLGLTTARLAHDVYNIGGHTVSYWQLRNITREEVPTAAVSFTAERGPIELPYLIDDSRLRQEFGFQHRPLGPAYRQLIRDVRTAIEGTT